LQNLLQCDDGVFSPTLGIHDKRFIAIRLCGCAFRTRVELSLAGENEGQV